MRKYLFFTVIFHVDIISSTAQDIAVVDNKRFLWQVALITKEDTRSLAGK